MLRIELIFNVMDKGNSIDLFNFIDCFNVIDEIIDFAA